MNSRIIKFHFEISWRKGQKIIIILIIIVKETSQSLYWWKKEIIISKLLTISRIANKNH